MVRLMLAESFFINRVAIVIEHNCDGRSWRCKWVPLFQLPSNEINKLLRRPSIYFSQSRTFLERALLLSAEKTFSRLSKTRESVCVNVANLCGGSSAWSFEFRRKEVLERA